MGFIITALKIIFLLGFLIIIHEGGHFIGAKICKIKVNEFAIGFGPKLFAKRIKETKYELRLIPFGGFVNLEGEEEHSDEEGSFSKASIPKRFSIIVAGAIVNIIFGILAYMILIAVNFYINVEANLINSLSYAISSTGTLIYAMFDSIIQLFSGNVSINDMVGPVGISQMVSETNGISQFIYLLSIISVSLGITNPFTICTIRWRKSTFAYNRSYKKKAIKTRNRTKTSISRLFYTHSIFSICSI